MEVGPAILAVGHGLAVEDDLGGHHVSEQPIHHCPYSTHLPAVLAVVILTRVAPRILCARSKRGMVMRKRFSREYLKALLGAPERLPIALSLVRSFPDRI